jgi:hypothetical protein
MHYSNRLHVSVLLLVQLLLCLFCSSHENTPDLFSKTLKLTIARLKDGRVAECSLEEKIRIQSDLKLKEVKFQSIDEGLQAIAESRELKQVSASLTGEHLLLTIIDSKGKIRYQTIAVQQLTESAKRAIQEAFRKQEEVITLEQQIGATQGIKRTELIIKLVGCVSEKNFVQYYPELLTELMASTEKIAGAVKESLNQIQTQEGRNSLANKLHFDLSMALRALPAGSGDVERIIIIDKFIADSKLEPEMKQLMVMRKYIVWSSAKNYTKALEALEEARLVQPESELAGRIPGFVENVRKRMTQAGAVEESKPGVPSPQVPLPPPVPEVSPSQPDTENAEAPK